MKRNYIQIVWFVILAIAIVATSRRVEAGSGWCGSPTGVSLDPTDLHNSPKCCHCTFSPCYVKAGNYVRSEDDLQLPTRGFPLVMSRNYSSLRPFDGPFGIGWTSNLNMRVTYSTYLVEAPSTTIQQAFVVTQDGGVKIFRENADGTFSSTDSSHDTFVKNVDNSFDFTPKLTRTKYHFAVEGALQSITDEYGNALIYAYDTNGRLSRVTDGTGSGRFFDLTYGPNGHVSSIMDSTGRQVSYEYGVNGELTDVTDAAYRTMHYSYTQERFGPYLAQIRDNWDRVITDVDYNAEGKTQSYSEDGETWSYTYNYLGDPNQTAKQDSDGNLYFLTFDSDGQITRVTTPMNDSTFRSYYPDGSVQRFDQSTSESVSTYYTYNPNGSIATRTVGYQYSGGGTWPIRFDYSYDANFPEKVTKITPKSPTTLVRDPNWQGRQFDYYPTGSAAPGALYHAWRVQSDGV